MNPLPNPFSILNIITIMKNKNRIEEKEYSQRVEISNKDSNSALIGMDPWID